MPGTGRRRRVWVFALVLAGALAGCRQSGLKSCLDLIDARRYEAAAQRCEEVYAAEAEPRAGAAAVKARYYLGQQEKVLAWVSRLVKDRKITAGVRGFAAAVHQQKGDVEKAEEEYRRDLALWRAAGDHRRTADTLYRLFYVSWGRSSYHETFLLASEALQEAAKAGDRELQVRAVQALYISLFEIGDLRGARRALETAKDLLDGQDQAGRANFLNHLGIVLGAEGRLALAQRNFEKALELGAGQAGEFFRGVHLNLTELNLKLGHVDRAAHHLAAAWKHAEPGEPPPASLLYYRARVDLAGGRPAQASQSLATALRGDPEPGWAWQLEYQQGRLAEAQGDIPTAEAAYNRSIDIIEEMRRSLAFDELKAWLLDEKRQSYEALFRLQARSGRAEEALATAERAQARAFLDAFLHASSVAETRVDKPWAIISLERIEGLEALLPAMSRSPVAALQPIGQVLSHFADRHGLVYFETGEEVWLIVVAGRKVRLHALPVPAAEIRRLAAQFLAHREDVGIAERLGEVLLLSGSLPEQGQAVFVVADGILGNLPFAAFRRQGRYLVEDHPIVFIPSLSALAALEDRQAGPYGAPVVLADPRGDLPAAAAEAEGVARLLGGIASTSMKATSGELARASHARTLHLATHTGSGPRGPWLQVADGQVSASEIVAGRIGPRLVVLASCASGVRPGRQMWGSLGAAFLAAGSRSVLASLWSIEDEHAREFVLRFYSEGGSSDPSRALARAQRVAIARGQPPTFWAPFVLFGSNRLMDDVH